MGLQILEFKAYKALVKIGKSSASRISREANVSYGKIYEVLASLEKKGFVRIIPEKTKLFVASSPAKVKEILERKKQLLMKIEKELDTMQKLYEISEEEPVFIAQGKKNWYKILKEIPDPNEFDYGIKWSVEFHPQYVQRYNKLKKKLFIKIL